MKLLSKDLEFWLLIASTLISMASLYVFFSSGQKLLADYDAIARLNITRKIFDSLTPGVAQLGGIWLPFPQILFIPFIQDDFLWHTGLAGAFGSMLSFILGSVFLFKTAFLVTSRRSAGLIAWLIYVTNINLLLLQSMAMSESFFLFTLIMIIFFLTKWAKFGRILDLMGCGLFVILTTLTRYEGYALFGAATLSVALVALAVYGKSDYHKLEGLILLFVTLAGFGIFIWSLYSWLIFKDPIYWLNLYSGRKPVVPVDPADTARAVEKIIALPAKLNLLSAFRIYGSAMVFMNGLLLSAAAAVSFIYLSLKTLIGFFKKQPDILILPSMIVTLCIFLFLIFGYYKNYIPHIETPLATLSGFQDQHNNYVASSNIRYGIIILPLVSLLIGIVFSKKSYLSVLPLLFLAIQAYYLGHPSLFLTFSLPVKYHYQVPESSRWFKANYDGGLILTSANRHENFIFQTQLPYKNFIYEGSQDLWLAALKDPRPSARYIVLDTVDGGDAVTQLLADKRILETSYDIVFKEANLLIYKLK